MTVAEMEAQAKAHDDGAERQIFKAEPGSPEWLELRTRFLTSTDAAALFGVSPYMTPFELHHRKARAEIVEFEPTDRIKWGMRLQDAIAAGIAADYGLKVRRMDEFIALPGRRLGASFDFLITEALPHSPYYKFWQKYGPGDLEVKNVDSLVFRDGWVVDGENIEAPPHIEIQKQHQMLTAGLGWGLIGALVGGNTVRVIPREVDRKVTDAILRRAEAFWQDVAAGRPPRPDYTLDKETLAAIYGYAEPGKVLDMRMDGIENQSPEAVAVNIALERYKLAGMAESEAKKLKDIAKGEILEKIGDAEKVLTDIGTLSAGLIAPTLVPAYERKGYRMFKPSFKKEKTNKETTT